MKSKVVVPQGLQFHVDEEKFGNDRQEPNGTLDEIISPISNSTKSTGTIMCVSSLALFMWVSHWDRY